MSDFKVTVMKLQDTPRGTELRNRRAFFECTHHDHHSARWDGSHRDPGVGYMHERLRPQGFVPTNSISHGMRKPDTHVPLGRQVVSRFTEMLLGEGRYPTLSVPHSESTETYLRTVFQESVLWDVLMEASDVAGSCGSAAVVVHIVQGAPTAEVLYPEDLYCVEWEEGLHWQPRDIIEQRLVDRQVLDEESGKVLDKKYWVTRRWTDEEVISYEDVEEVVGSSAKDFLKIVDRVKHGAGKCPVVWYQRTRNTRAPEGRSDYDGAEHLIDQLDRIMSQTVKGTRANVDPTLVLKEDQRHLQRNPVIRKGAGNIIPVSPQGDAKYLEMSGQSIKMGLDVSERLYHQICETVECVIVDAANAGAYRSGEAMQMLWRSMESKTNRLRVPLVQVIARLGSLWASMGIVHGVNVTAEGSDGEVQGIRLQALADPEHKDVAAGIVKNPYVTISWPPYWNPTPQQEQAKAVALTAAVTGDLLSPQTGLEEFAAFIGIDPTREAERVQEAADETKSSVEALLADALQGEDKEDDEDFETEDEDEEDDVDG